jgi:hypothetical protein
MRLCSVRVGVEGNEIVAEARSVAFSSSRGWNTAGTNTAAEEQTGSSE